MAARAFRRAPPLFSEPAPRAAFGHAVAAALVDVGRRCPRCAFSLKYFRGVVFAPILRTIAQAARVGVVEPRAVVVRDAVDDLEAHVRVLDADRDELRHVAPAD